MIQEGISEKFKVRLNVIKHGFGSQITGNVARRLFNNCKALANITKVDLKTIEKLKEISELSRSISIIDINHYNELCSEILIDLNGIYLTPILHKYLHHGGDILQYFQSNYDAGL